MNRHFLFAFLLALLFLALTACGGAGEEESPEDVPPEAEVETQSEPETQPETEEEPPVEDAQAKDAQAEIELQSEPEEFVLLEASVLPEAHIVGDAVNVRELAYDSRRDGDRAVYVPENQRYVPFLVLSGDYGGNALLLRRDVLPDTRAFNNYSAYYEDSEIDRWLNGEYAAQLAEIESLICPSDILITQEESLGASGNAVKTITRNIFLLSCAETGFANLANTGTEGSALPFFDAVENRIARIEDGSAASWWLRTPDAYYLSAAYGIGPDGTLGSGNAYNENGVRPALCVPSDALAFPSDTVADGANVYVLLP